MPRQESILIYKFSELSAQAKERAKYDYKGQCGYSEEKAAIESLKAMAEHFDATVTYEVDFFNCSHSSADFKVRRDALDIGYDNLPDGFQHHIGSSDATDDDAKAAYEKWLKDKLDELGTYNPETLKGHGDGAMTGDSADDDAIDGFRKAWSEGERDLGKLLQAGFDSWLESAQSQAEAEYEDENFGDFCDANDKEFYEDGRVYQKKK